MGIRRILENDALVPLAIDSPNDDIFEADHIDEQNQDVFISTVSSIFNVEKLNLPEGARMHTKLPKGVDREGNFYCVANIDSFSTVAQGEAYKYAILKYDQALAAFTFFAPYDKDENDQDSQFCFDERNSLCYITGNRLKRIKADGTAIVDQSLDFSTTTYRRRSFKGISAADNGGLFFLVEYTLEDRTTITKLYRLSPNGIVTDMKVGDRISGNGRRLHKISGPVIFTYDGEQKYSRIDVYTKEVVPVQLNFHVPPGGVTASPNHAYLYAINENKIMRIRHFSSSDLTIGAIPNHHKDETGKFVKFENNFNELYMGWEDTVFYSFDTNNGGEYIYRFLL